MQKHSLQEGHGFFPFRVAVSQCGASFRGVDWWSTEMGRSETSFIRDWDERRVFLTVLLTEHSNLFDQSSVIVLSSAANFRICLCEILKWLHTSWFSFVMARAAGTRRIASAAGSTRT